MMTPTLRPARSLAVVVVAALLAACQDAAPVAPPEPQVEPAAEGLYAARGLPRGTFETLRTLAVATARYHDLEQAIRDGYVFLHGCEVRPGEGAVGILYVHMERLLDGVLDPRAPEALLYAPREKGPPRLVGVELAMPYALWAPAEPPTFLGQSFQPEEEFGVWGLHIWLWSANPEGLFAESNPRISCGEE